MDSVVRRLVALRLVRWGAAEQNGTILTGAKMMVEWNSMGWKNRTYQSYGRNTRYKYYIILQSHHIYRYV